MIVTVRTHPRKGEWILRPVDRKGHAEHYGHGMSLVGKSNGKYIDFDISGTLYRMSMERLQDDYDNGDITIDVRLEMSWDEIDAQRLLEE